MNRISYSRAYKAHFFIIIPKNVMLDFLIISTFLIARVYLFISTNFLTHSAREDKNKKINSAEKSNFWNSANKNCSWIDRSFNISTNHAETSTESSYQTRINYSLVNIYIYGIPEIIITILILAATYLISVEIFFAFLLSRTREE